MAPPARSTAEEDIRRVLSYHRRTKHHLYRYAASPGSLDWANQPDPFRTYAGTPTIDLPLLADAVSVQYGELNTPGAVAPRSLDVNSVALLFELALGLSAWKQYKDSRWAVRCNPSSGNLHPTEGYAVVPPIAGLDAGVYHYDSRDHRLERRCNLDPGRDSWCAAGLPAGCFLVGLTSIHWREAWKYGERAFRYCQLDIGHAIAAVRYAAATLGWSACLLGEPGTSEIGTLLGTNRDADYVNVSAADHEEPGPLLLVGPADLAEVSQFKPDPIGARNWAGVPNRLSRDHVRWEVIEGVAEATRKPRTPTLSSLLPGPLPAGAVRCPEPAARLIRQRRSCLGLDGHTVLDATTVYTMLDRTLPRPGVPPWDALPWPPHLHAGVLVHRVRGLKPGLYFLERDPALHEELRAAFRSEFLWTRIPGCHEHLPFFLLAEGDFRDRARTVSCHQDIASDGVLSLGMIAAFGDTIRRGGAWWYDRLFWEAGVLGQLLYLEAEAAGVRSTGIGCYFDDSFHELLGLNGDRFQDLYHFTVGGPVDDPRIQSQPPYAHLAGR